MSNQIIRSTTGKRAHFMLVAPESKHERDILRLAFLAADIQRDILAGDQPPDPTLEKLRRLEIPWSWIEQRSALGWV